MSTKAAGSKADIESKQAMSTKAPNSKHNMSTAGMKTDIKSKQDMPAKVPDTKAYLYFDQLQVDVTGTIVVMIGRMWDVSAVTGRYLSTDFIVSDAKEEYRILKNDTFMLEFDGSTTIRKAFVKVEGFVRYHFQLVDFDSIEPTNNKYLIDVASYATNVGRTTYQKSGSKNLDFYLANHRVTLWRGLGDVLIEKKRKHIGMCRVILTSTIAKYYNDKLYLSRSSSTINFDDAEIHTLKTLRLYENSGAKSKNPSLLVDLSQPSLQPSTARKGVAQKLGKFWCDACNTPVDYPVLRYRLELDVSYDTTHVVVVMFDEPTTSLVKCSGESIVEADDESLDDHESLPPAIANLIGVTHVLEIKSHTYYEYGNFESFTCWKVNPVEGVEDNVGSSTMDAVADTQTPKLKRLAQHPSVPTPLKPSDERKKKRVDIEESNAEASGDSAKGVSKDRAARVSDMKKRSGAVYLSQNPKKLEMGEYVTLCDMFAGLVNRIVMLVIPSRRVFIHRRVEDFA
ncbi:replication protein A 70 kDa DNA-binding subunit C-like protein [Tanacetum coccineum]